MGKLPDTLIKAANPELRNVEVGTTVFIEPAAMRVTAELDCFLLPTIRVHEEKSTIHTLQVRRAIDGFHVTILGHDKWSSTTPKAVRGWIPVASVREEYNPDLPARDNL